MRNDERDAARYRALRDICERSVGAYLSVREHRLVYEDQPHEFGAVYLQVYPDTPCGFTVLGGATFDEMMDAVVAADSDTAA